MKCHQIARNRKGIGERRPVRKMSTRPEAATVFEKA
jgi:hypothetical protein